MAILGTYSKLEVPTIYKANFLGLCKAIFPQNVALYGTIWYSTSILGSWRSPIEKTEKSHGTWSNTQNLAVESIHSPQKPWNVDLFENGGKQTQFPLR